MDTTIYTDTAWETLLLEGALIPVLVIVSLMLGFLLMAALCGIFVKVITGGGATRDRRKLERQETEAFQDLERGFRRMEERLDSLETLLIGQPNRPATDRELREL